jgi:hypothetical protein
MADFSGALGIIGFTLVTLGLMRAEDRPSHITEIVVGSGDRSRVPVTSAGNHRSVEASRRR